ncbi:hypothetical protein GGS26DRAFT_102856 [Hypomontagnella submonticulosa]|nr:hypothetical protein GGS26DRAFT_102856 [Hypomontagnella submonticulosa]
MATLKADTSGPTATATATTGASPRHDIPPHQPQSQPQSQSQSQAQAQAQAQPEPQPQSRTRTRASTRTSEPNAKEYYGYLFNKDRSPTHTLNALLRAIAHYISTNLGDTNVRELNPSKLAAFYREVGGDYDQLFLQCPHKSISYIWQALGVQHTLQPTDNDYEPPSIPALTARGFVRWESIQILLEPQEHVPFMQFAVRNWPLVNPDTGKPFPVDLPAEAFPSECDPETDAWHKECARRLREEATPKDEEPPIRRSSDPRVHTTFAHVRNPQGSAPAPRRRPEMDYFQRERPVSFAHVSSTNYAGPYISVNYSPGQRRASSGNSGSSSLGRSSSSSPDRPPRRPSYSDVRRSEMEDRHPSVHLDPHRPHVPRRHSQTKHYSASPSDSGSDLPPRPNSKARVHGPAPPPISVRRMPVETPVPSTIPVRPRRSEARPDDPRRRSLPAEIRQKVTSFLSGSSDRHRSSSRETRHPPNVVPSVRFRREGSSHLSRSASGGDSYPSDESDAGVLPPRYPSRRDRDRDRLRDRVMEKEHLRERERDEEFERSRRQERAYIRPVPRRASSHTDADRRSRDYTWERRERDRDIDYDRDGRRVMTADERESRDRRRYTDRGQNPSVTGVGGRRYPGEPSWK